MAKIKTSSKTSSKHRPKGVSKRTFEKAFWPYLPLVLATCLLLFFGQSANLTTALKQTKSHVLAYSSSMSTGGLLVGTNAQRTANGVSTLSLNDRLNAAAQAKANDMAARNYWSHNTPEGNPPWVFVSTQGYSYQKLGENLATGFNDEQSTINGWMASPPHRENLLDPSFSEVGFGYANNPDYTAAGGGPMTIVVAYYGQPQVLSSTVIQPPPPVHAAIAAGSSTPTATPTPTAPAPAEATPQETPTKTITNPKTPNTIKPLSNTSTPSVKSSHAQIALANLPVSGIATSLAIFLLLAALLIWTSKHLLAIRHVIISGEGFALRHPIADAGLVIIIAISYLLTQTAGFVR